MRDPKVVLAELKKLADRDDVLMNDMEHAFVQTCLRQGLPADVSDYAERIIDRYKEDV